MTRFQLSTFRSGLLVSAIGLAAMFAAATMFVRGHDLDGHGFLARLRWSGLVGVAGLTLTVAGFAAMNVGAVRSGSGFTSVDPGEVSHTDSAATRDATPVDTEPTVSEPGRSPITVVGTAVRCIACSEENRPTARFCDQCGERL